MAMSTIAFRRVSDSAVIPPVIVLGTGMNPVGGREFKPHLITDRMGYNSFSLAHSGDQTPAPNWVPP